MWWSRRCAVAVACLALLTTVTAEAGVKGGKFTGPVWNSIGTTPNTVINDFGNDGAFKHNEGHIFYGSYSEQTTGFGVTTWQAVVSDGSPNGHAEFGGTCWFGLITTWYLTNLDINVTAWGVLTRSGTANTAREDSKAVEPAAATGNTP